MAKRYFNRRMIKRVKANPNLSVPFYLMASYLYYIHDKTIITDEYYDRLAKFMLRRWDEIRHQHKRLIKKSDLRAGTLYRLTDADYPKRVKGAAGHLFYKLEKEAKRRAKMR